LLARLRKRLPVFFLKKKGVPNMKSYLVAETRGKKEKTRRRVVALRADLCEEKKSEYPSSSNGGGEGEKKDRGTYRSRGREKGGRQDFCLATSPEKLSAICPATGRKEEGRKASPIKTQRRPVEKKTGLDYHSYLIRGPESFYLSILPFKGRGQVEPTGG